MFKDKVMLMLCRKVVAELLTEVLQKRIGVEAFGMFEFENAKTVAMLRKPAIALVEVPEHRGTPALEALAACADIKAASPACKIVLICPENDEDSVKTTIAAIKEGKIDDFMFYDLSVDYLVAKCRVLLPA